jgi:hypothetical protein
MFICMMAGCLHCDCYLKMLPLLCVQNRVTGGQPQHGEDHQARREVVKAPEKLQTEVPIVRSSAVLRVLVQCPQPLCCP